MPAFKQTTVTETGYLPNLYMAGIILLYSVTDDIYRSLLKQILEPILLTESKQNYE